MADSLQPGCRVKVPLGRKDRIVVGYCTKITREVWKSTLKPVCEQVDPEPLLSAHMLELCDWIASYYAAPLGMTVEAMVPAGAKSATTPPTVRAAVWTGPADPVAFRPARRPETPRGRPRPARRRCDPATGLITQAGCTSAPLRTLEQKGLPCVTDAPDEQSKEAGLFSPARSHRPQLRSQRGPGRACRRANAAIDAAIFRVLVLYGVTGCGKTEVYIRAIRDCLAAGQTGHAPGPRDRPDHTDGRAPGGPVAQPARPPQRPDRLASGPRVAG